MSYNVYHWCLVPECKNTSVKTPQKLWIQVPNRIKMRNTWLKLARRDPKSLSTKSKVYFCEDHFDLKNDMENYTQYKIMGSVKRIRMKPNCVPSRFDCQADRKHKFTPREPRRAFIKRQRMSMIKEIEETIQNKNYVTPLPPCSQGASPIEENIGYKIPVSIIKDVVTLYSSGVNQECVTSSFEGSKEVTMEACNNAHAGTMSINDYVSARSTKRSGESGHCDSDELIDTEIPPRQLLSWNSTQSKPPHGKSASTCSFTSSVGLENSAESGCGLNGSSPSGVQNTCGDAYPGFETFYIKEEPEDYVFDDVKSECESLTADLGENDIEENVNADVGNEFSSKQLHESSSLVEDTVDNNPSASVKEENAWEDQYYTEMQNEAPAVCSSSGSTLVEDTVDNVPSIFVKEENAWEDRYCTEMQNDAPAVCSSSDMQEDGCLYHFNQLKSNCSKDIHSQIPEDHFECPCCIFITSRKLDLEVHMLIHTQEGPFKYSSIDGKENSSGETPFKCTVCSFATSAKSYLNKHKLIHTEERRFKCSHCSFACKTNSHLITHTRTHTGENPFKCTLCPFSCKTKSHLKIHMRSHTGERPFKCTLCSYAGFTKSHLTLHMRYHGEERPFPCPHCSFAFKGKADLVRHVRTHTGERPFQCVHCSFASKTKAHLKVHMLTHTGERPFKCPHCSYACKMKAHLTAHIRTHTGESPFKCMDCSFACKTKPHLKLHMLTHTGEMPFKCSYCSYTCKTKSSLTRHMSYHGEDTSLYCNQ